MIKSDNRKLESFLTSYGLTKKQAKIYLVGLEIGQASVQEISQGANIGRTNSYDAIKTLVDKGLMAVSTKGKRKVYISQSPKTLKKIWDSKKEELLEMLPKLESIHSVTISKPKILFFPGLEGYKTAYEDSNRVKSKKLFGIYSPKDNWEVLGKEYAEYMIAQRIKKRINLRVLRSKSRETNRRYPGSQTDLREVRFLPENIDFPITTYVYDNKVLILSSKKELFGLIIESEDISAAHQSYFETLWNISKPYK